MNIVTVVVTQTPGIMNGVPVYKAPPPHSGSSFVDIFPQFARCEIKVDMDSEDNGYVRIIGPVKIGSFLIDDKHKGWIEKTHLEKADEVVPGTGVLTFTLKVDIAKGIAWIE